MSAIIPGLGQIYNRKYWKPPLIYAGAYALIHFAKLNNGLYQDYRAAHFAVANDTTCDASIEYLCNRYSEAMLEARKDDYRKKRDLNFVLLAGLYIFNVIDATVDAHLFSFDVSDDLSLKFDWRYDPYYGNSALRPRLNLSYKL